MPIAYDGAVAARLHRRDFLRGSVAAALATRLRGAPTAASHLSEFPYGAVTLTGGPLKRQYDAIHAHFLALDNDRLLKVYRQRAGLPAPGEDMGGWYDADGFVPGHTLGQYISGLSRIYAATKDPVCAIKVNALVTGFAATLGPDGYPYASEKAATTWPCYILDKYEAGMLDASRLVKNTDAKRVLVKAIEGAIPHIPDHTYDRGPDSPKQAPYDEPYVLPENLFNTWELTGDRKYLDMAGLYLLDHDLYDPLAQNRNVLPGKHAYSHAIALSSAARAYEILLEEKYLTAIRNAWDMLEQTQQFASGGWGPKEAFVPPGEGKLGESLTTTRDHFETPCGCYAHTKLARYLLRFTGESRYGDGLENILYNALLASKDPGGDGEYFYYSDYQALAKKGYYKRKWPCCSGTLLQSVADSVLNVCFHRDADLFVNLYTPSEVRWTVDRAPVTLIQETRYPDDGEMHFRIQTPAPATFTLNLRIPRWATGNPKILVNGKSFSAASEPGTFASISRTWQNSDTVQLSLPLDFRVQAVDAQHPERVAIMRGTQMLVAVNPPPDLQDQPLHLPGKPQPVSHQASVFTLQAQNGRVTLAPFYQVRDEAYTTYLLREAQ
ncbi:MAG TPA: beta-L-arabinofuranosidase domain-containing protein [Bryobacteraceae bacterium]|nr:beta-L-arabinofuranosidase domain-containing protein [Bryobacteraceae bacterium]